MLRYLLMDAIQLPRYTFDPNTPPQVTICRLESGIDATNPGLARAVDQAITNLEQTTNNQDLLAPIYQICNSSTTENIQSANFTANQNDHLLRQVVFENAAPTLLSFQHIHASTDSSLDSFKIEIPIINLDNLPTLVPDQMKLIDKTGTATSYDLPQAAKILVDTANAVCTQLETAINLILSHNS